MKKLIVSLVVLVLLCGVQLQSEDLKFPAVSPKGKVTQTIGVSDVSVDYSRPGVKGRTIWGKLVPLDKVWRTGANEPSFLEFESAVTVAGKKIEAGKYALFTIPGKEKWTFIISKQIGIWGAMGYKESEDVVRVEAKPEAAPMQEWMLFGFDKLTDGSARLYLHWEKVKVGFEIGIDTKGAIVGAIKKKMGRYWVSPYRAADYALKNGLIEEAKKWVKVSIANKKIYWNVLLKAKIYKKAGADKSKIIKILDKAVSMVPELPENQRQYAKEAETLLKELKK